MKSHYKPQVVIIFERFKFYSRNQGTTESVADFVAGIKSCARTCEFGNGLDEALRDRLVMGLRNESTQRALLTVKDLTFAQAVEMATSREAAAKDVVEIGASQTSGSHVNYQFKSKIQKGGNFNNFSKSKSGTTVSKPMNACSGCGNMHWKKNCPMKDAKCYKCGRKGHIKKVCKSKVAVANRTDVNEAVNVPVTQAVNNSIPELGEYDFDDYVFYEGQVNSNEPIVVDTLLNNVAIPMILDTGAARSVISLHNFDKYFKTNKPKLKPSSVVLKKYGNVSMNIAGEVKVSVKLKNTSSSENYLPLLVIAEEGPSLLGRDWMSALNINFGSDIINSIQSNAILDKYPELFQEGLGKFNKYPISLEIDPNVAPKFCKARPVPSN